MPGKAYAIYIGVNALNYQKELINPNHREGQIPPTETLISARLSMELNGAGALSFEMPPTHPFYGDISPMVTEVIVSEIDNVLWYGRVTDYKTNWNRIKTVTCEGAFAYLNDSIQPREELYNLTPTQYLTKLLTNHNAQVPEKRRITLGTIKSTSGVTITKTLNYQSTIDMIQDFLSEYEGYIYVIMAPGGGSVLSWIDSRDMTSAQSVTYGQNLLDLATNVDYIDICTCIMPLGADVEMAVPDLDENGSQLYEDETGYQSTTQNATYSTPSTKIIEVPLNLGMTEDNSVEPDENGITPIRFIQASTTINSLVVDGPHVGTYGRIIRAVTFEDAYTVSDLRAKATGWINKQDIGGIEIDILAADMRFLDETAGRFYLGMNVAVTSSPHGINETLVITKIEIDVMNVSKKITLGRLNKKSLSEILGRGQTESVGKPNQSYMKLSSVKKVDAKDSGILFIPA